MLRRLAVVFALVSIVAFAQDSPAFRRAQHLRHGINVSEWFAQSNDYSPQRLRTFTKLEDIDRIKKMGFDHIRISIDPQVFDCFRWNSNCERVQVLDDVVNRAANQDLAVMIDLHPNSEYKKQVATNGDEAQRAALLWERIAAHYAKSNPDLLFFELMNEPELGDAYKWNGIQEALAASVRRAAPQHTIIVAGARYSDIEDLVRMPDFADHNLIFNFHYYEPHTFTHQGASWGSAYWLRTQDLPFPATPENMAPILAQQPDDFTRWQLEEFALSNWNAARIEGEMAFAADWAKRHNVPLICNEFGAYREHTRPEDRMRWISAVRGALEKNHIGWTMWDYQGGFGVVHVKDGQVTEDAAVLQALGLK
ncbi:glycoside hydrolase, family 5 [Candidatus Koribacter versatilis Ellin345]|uniref:Glycoside hydrolase, family 5 n=1 Tax=Koribacter versatilis (strain Ellin345) TaxID=204669 RepID=Q1IR10_KORVE|nr:cellulase family glycosylhydrolase [Candidatus Koribacter versatilis]ABF40690.1 glycoside hydrolase, family 5 [Candidatus Koribacter versatilis Ellin345]